MAKILVGLYDTLVEAERVVVDLIEHDFVRIAMRRMIHNAQGHEADEADSSEELYAAEGGFIDELTDLDVPVDEARSYAEGLLQGGVLVVVRSSDTTADRGIEIMNQWGYPLKARQFGVGRVF
jgi:hypothetical protein